jgi:phage terminase large subunit-like protein
LAVPASRTRRRPTSGFAYEEFKADRVIAEINFGGAMVEFVLKAAGRNLPVKVVTALRGKAQRAEPIAALYEQGRVSHVGCKKDQSIEFPNDLAELEDQLCQMTNYGYTGDGSPDRLDAAVWALTELMLEDADPLNVTDAFVHDFMLKTAMAGQEY